MKYCGIYKISSKLKPSRFYIGSANDIGQRWTSHRSILKRNIHHSVKLQRHYNKYGKEDLKYEIILCCDKDDLIRTEQYFIDMYKPYFNLCFVAGSCVGFKHTEETKKKMSNSTKGFRHSEETKQLMSDIAMGIKKSPEARAKMSKAKKGKPTWNKGLKGVYTEEYKRKISEARRGKATTTGMRWKLSKEMIEKIKIKRAETRRLNKLKQVCQN